MKTRIDINNWPDQFPYSPEVECTLSAEGRILVLDFKVKEESTIARATHNFDEVWKDSCCELFIMFEGEDRYYNLETSCNGYQLFSYREDRHSFERAAPEVMDMISCRTSLEKHATFGPTHIDEWTLEIRIPAKAFWRSGIKNFKDVKAKGNIYKCLQAEGLPQHFLSWAPIESLHPDFHRPEFFRSLSLED